MGFKVQDAGFKVSDAGFKVVKYILVSAFRAPGFWCRFLGNFRVYVH